MLVWPSWGSLHVTCIGCARGLTSCQTSINRQLLCRNRPTRLMLLYLCMKQEYIVGDQGAQREYYFSFRGSWAWVRTAIWSDCVVGVPGAGGTIFCGGWKVAGSSILQLLDCAVVGRFMEAVNMTAVGNPTTRDQAPNGSENGCSRLAWTLEPNTTHACTYRI